MGIYCIVIYIYVDCGLKQLTLIQKKSKPIYNLKTNTTSSVFKCYFNMIIALIEGILCILLYKPIKNTLHNINYRKRISPPMTYRNNAPLTDSIPQKL